MDEMRGGGREQEREESGWEREESENEERKGKRKKGK